MVLIFVGQFCNEVQVAAAGLCIPIEMIFIESIGYGINGIIETKASQAFGAGEYRLCGEALNRGQLLITLVMIPLAILALFLGPILVAIGQDPNVAIFAA